MANDYRLMLQAVLKGLPSNERLAFLSQVAQSLSKRERERLLADLARLNATDLDQEEAEAIPEPEEAKPVVTAQPEAKELPGAVPEIHPPVRRPEPQPKPKIEPTASRPIDNPSSLELDDQDRHRAEIEKKARIEAEFKKFLAHSQVEKTTEKSMRVQLLGCFGLGLLGVGGLIALAVGGKKLAELLGTMF